MALVSRLLRLSLVLGLALGIAALLAPLPAQAQGDPVFCVYRHTVYTTPTSPSFEFTAVRCDQAAGLGSADWSPFDLAPATFAAASAEAATLNAESAPVVFCVYMRTINIVPNMPSREFTVVRCDQVSNSGGVTGTWTQAGGSVTVAWPTFNTTDIVTLRDGGLSLVGTYGTPTDPSRPIGGEPRQGTSSRPSC